MGNKIQLSEKEQERERLILKIKEKEETEEKTVRLLIKTIEKNVSIGSEASSWLLSKKLAKINSELVLTNKGIKILSDYGYIK